MPPMTNSDTSTVAKKEPILGIYDGDFQLNARVSFRSPSKRMVVAKAYCFTFEDIVPENAENAYAIKLADELLTLLRTVCYAAAINGVPQQLVIDVTAGSEDGVEFAYPAQQENTLQEKIADGDI